MTLFTFTIEVDPSRVADVGVQLMACGINVKVIGLRYVSGMIAIDPRALEPTHGWGTFDDQMEDTKHGIERILRRSGGDATLKLVSWHEQCSLGLGT